MHAVRRLLLVALGSLLLGAIPASANTIAVTSNADSGPGTLRSAIASANAGDTITIPPMTITLSSGELLVDKSLTLSGAGASQTIISGGGVVRVFDVSGSPVTISGLTITDGAGKPTPASTQGDGGGVYSGGASVTLSDVALTANDAEDGGGATSNAGTLTIQRSLVSGNTASSRGAGLAGSSGGLVVVDSTLTGNSVAAGGRGGGVYLNQTDAAAATTKFVNDTIINNDASPTGIGGGIEENNASQSPTAVNTIIAGNTAKSGQENCDTVPVGFSLGHNIDSRNECHFTAAGDQINTDPKLGPLGPSGGPTEAQIPLPGSPALDAADASRCPSVDQRGVSRPQGSGCDVGAVERTTPADSAAFADALTPTGATLHASANTQGLTGRVQFEYGPTAGFGAVTQPISLPASASAQNATATLTGLTPDTTYSFAMVLTTADGTVTSATATLHTPAVPVLAPNTKIAHAKITARHHSATFSFTATGTATGFQCALVTRKHPRPRFTRCATPKTYRHLRKGKYTFQVRAVGPGGADPSPATKKFTIG
jgi:hypothetical protein